MNYYEQFKGFLKKFGITIAEWHSLIIGVTTAGIGGPALAGLVYSMTATGAKLRGHFKDVKKEFAYFSTSFCTVEVIQWLMFK